MTNNNAFVSKFHQAASIYAEKLGWYVFPIAPREKRPATANGHLNATLDQALIREFWSRIPYANVGIALKPSGIVVLDFDSKPDLTAHEAMVSFEQEFGSLPDTPCSITGAGFHFLFKTDVPVGRSIKIRQGLDVLGDGYIVAAPSIHPSGQEYAWDSYMHPLSTPMAQAPEWLLSIAPVGFQNIFTGESLLPDEIPNGERNDTLARVIGHLLRRHVSPDLVYKTAISINLTRCKPPIPNSEVEQIFVSICNREFKRRNKRGA
jgi:hypothetical protein